MIILGSTGSIGTQALQIARAEHLAIEVLCAGENIDLLNAQIAEFRPKIAVIKDSTKRHLVRGASKVLCGEVGILEAINESKSNLVLNALVGFSGVHPSLEAIKCGKTLALANKESLVVAGFLIDSAKLRQIIPVDSEHFALKELLDSVCGNLSLELHSADSANFECSQTPSLVSHSKFAENYESQTENPSVVLNANSADSSLRESRSDSWQSKQNQNANSSIFDEKSGLCSCERGNKINGLLTKRTTNLPDLSQKDAEFATHIKKMIITASGGAFRDLPLSEIPSQCAKSALKHPNWAMGRKITIDSATMINKLFEILEAKWLFGIANIDAVIERNSTIHAMIQTNDNAFIAHLSSNDMKLPIATALLGAKARNRAFIKELDLMNLCIRFEQINCNRYPLWNLKDSLLKCPKLGIIINAANDILVEQFLQNSISFGDISSGIFAVVDRFGGESALDSIKNIDEIADLNAKIADFLKSY